MKCKHCGFSSIELERHLANLEARCRQSFADIRNDHRPVPFLGKCAVATSAVEDQAVGE